MGSLTTPLPEILFKDLAPHFPPDVRRRGAALVSRVKIVAVDQEGMRAQVWDGRPCQVAIEVDPPDLGFACDCGAFDDATSCPHIWAALLAVERDLRTLSAPPQRSPAVWKTALAQVRAFMFHSSPAVDGRSRWPAGREILYIVDLAGTRQGQGLQLEALCRDRKKGGAWGNPSPRQISCEAVLHLPDPLDRELLGLFKLCDGSAGYSSYGTVPSQVRLQDPLPLSLLARLCEQGRLRLRASPGETELKAPSWDDGPPWEFFLEMSAASGGGHALVGSLRRGDERMELRTPLLLSSGGLLFLADRIARFEHGGAFAWISLLRQHQSLPVPRGHEEEAVADLLDLPRLPRLDLPQALRFTEVATAPKPCLRIAKPRQQRHPSVPEYLEAELTFDYGGHAIPASRPGAAVALRKERQLLRRDAEAERAASARLASLGFRRRHEPWGPEVALALAPSRLPKAVRALLAESWQVEAEGALYRRAGAVHVQVQSGIDWFDLKGEVEFGDQIAPLPALLAALRRREPFVQLGDGSFGLLPEEWLKRYVAAAGVASVEGDRLRFRRSQAGLLDAFLDSQPEARWDEAFARAREEVRRFERVEPCDPPEGFVGELREYQRYGLGWLSFLRQFGFGGCLADDMGLGKTVQVLALLESRRGAPDRAGPSLVVVPRSLVFNWKQEAARFAPGLRVLDHTGAGRVAPGAHFQQHDLVLTTYGTLRRDAVALAELRFDYVILDEAQAVKNARTESAKAARVLDGAHRLALSGTPVENHLGELWSLFEFLNPGLLGASAAFEAAVERNPDEETRRLLTRALRPFFLRRTKEQVARDLPQRSEQILQCDLEPEQRRLYDELRDHYRQALLARVDRDGLARSKMHVLEALLRLRQAACHPGLVDKKRAGEPAAKLDTLLEQLTLVLDEGHKALVFSQFTQLLGIVRRRLDQAGIAYEYLDGRTRDRAARVERFQNQPDSRLFLISLKAGGLGLNLTAADYVFLVDPWWNPAVEAQAIDRAHRIGQDKPVFAYRLIARNTIEEKVVALQEQKRDLADAILGSGDSLLRSLTRSDLDQLLS